MQEKVFVIKNVCLLQQANHNLPPFALQPPLEPEFGLQYIL